MQRLDLNRLPQDDHAMWLNVEKAAWRLALASGNVPQQIRPMPRSLVNGLYGRVTYTPKGPVLQLSLRQTWSRQEGFGSRYRMSSIFETMCHEMAHVKQPRRTPHHGSWFVKEYSRMLALAEEMNLRDDFVANEVCWKREE